MLKKEVGIGLSSRLPLKCKDESLVEIFRMGNSLTCQLNWLPWRSSSDSEGRAKTDKGRVPLSEFSLKSIVITLERASKWNEEIEPAKKLSDKST